MRVCLFARLLACVGVRVLDTKIDKRNTAITLCISGKFSGIINIEEIKNTGLVRLWDPFPPA